LRLAAYGGLQISTKSLPTWGGRKAPPPVAGPSKIKKEEETKTKEKEKPKPEKPKPTGKLDFSKAKTKPLKKEEEKPAKAEPKPKVAAASTIGDKVQAKMDESKVGSPLWLSLTAYAYSAPVVEEGHETQVCPRIGLRRRRGKGCRKAR
jgi:hypothetical protein